MRLIDADELMELLRLRKDSGIGTEIDEIKTVEAIPIEQIKKKLLSGQYEYENDYDIGFDKGWNCALRALLRDWEKENADTD